MRGFVIVTVTLLALAVAGCQSGHVNVLGYTTKPNFDPEIRSIYVPMFKNIALQTTPHRGLEVDITQAVVKEISTRTPMKIVTDPERADTELLGTLMKIEKTQLNRNQQNAVREAEITLTVTVVWRDLRDGRVLSNRRPPRPTEAPIPQFDPTLPPKPEENVRETPYAVTLTASGRVLPELGETTATADQMAVNQLAKQIVNMMESPW
jgi:hypothetical protein